MLSPTSAVAERVDGTKRLDGRLERMGAIKRFSLRISI